jgi:hypothetical protein
VKHPVALNHHVRILQQVLRVDRPEVALAGPEHDGYDVHAHLVDQTRGKRLATDVASGDLDHAVTRKLLRLCHGCLDGVTTTTWSIPPGGFPSQPSVMSKTWRPTSVAPIWSQYGRV